MHLSQPSEPLPADVVRMHAGEEILIVLVPIFLILIVVDWIKRRKARGEPSSADEQRDAGHGVGDHQSDESQL